MKKKLTFILITFFLLSCCGTTLAADSIALSVVKINIYDENMQKIDEAVFYDFSEGSSDFIYPITATYMDITAQRSNESDSLAVMIDGFLFAEEPYYALEEDAQNVEIIVFGTSEDEQSFPIELIRSTLPRDNALSQAEWSFTGMDGEIYFPDALAITDAVTVAEVPASVTTVSLDSYYTLSTFTEIVVVDGNNDIYNGNADTVAIDMTKGAVSVSIETYIDNTTSAYILTLQKTDELSADCALESLTVSFLDGEDNYSETEIKCRDGVYDYSAPMPDDCYGFDLFAKPKHVIAETEYNSESIEYDEMGFPYFALDNDLNIVTITVTAENEDVKTYTLNVTKDKDTEALATAEPIETTSTVADSGTGIPYWVWIIAGGAVLAASAVLLIVMRKKKKS